MEKYTQLPLSVLDQYEEYSTKGLTGEKIEGLFQEEYEKFQRKVIVLDDDPTGIQTVHDVSVYTEFTQQSIDEGMKEENSMFFVLTNSRSFTEDKTREVHLNIAHNIVKANKTFGKDYLVISRGDSTLRGHYPLEMEVLRDGLMESGGKEIDGQILLPYFREGGRFTIDNVHYVKDGEWLIPAGQTEFAKDKTFGYSSSHLGDYVEEKSKGGYPKENAISIPLSWLRGCEIDKITQLLMTAKDFQPILVDSISENDVKVFAIGLMQAMAKGKEFLIRSAAALPKVMGNVKTRSLLTREEVMDTAVEKAYGGLVIVGSHVNKTTKQLDALKESSLDVEYLEFDVGAWNQRGGLEGETKRIIEEAENRMETGGTVVVYTSRNLLAPPDTSKEELLQLSVGISDAVTGIVSGLHKKPSFLVAKGGITSSDIGTKGLQVKKARVMGQISPGIPVWETGEESRFPNLPYIIFPGNVGEVDTLKQIIETLMPTRET